MAFSDLVNVADGAVRALLGGPVVYQPAFGQAVTVQGVFEPRLRRDQDVDLVGVVAVGPAVFLRLADLPEDPTGKTPSVIVGGTTYRVREAQKDGQGGVTLHLLAT